MSLQPDRLSYQQEGSKNIPSTPRFWIMHALNMWSRQVNQDINILCGVPKKWSP